MMGVIGVCFSVLLAGTLLGQSEVTYHPTYLSGDKAFLPTAFSNTPDIDTILGNRLRSYLDGRLRSVVCESNGTSIIVFDQQNLDLHVTRQEGFKQDAFVKAYEAIVGERVSILVPLSNTKDFDFSQNFSEVFANDCGTMDEEEVPLADFQTSSLDVGNNRVRITRIPLSSDDEVPEEVFNTIRAFLDNREGESPLFILAYTSSSPQLPEGIDSFAALERAEASEVQGGTFWTPAIWMSLLTSILLLSILLTGVCWIMSVQSDQKLDVGGTEDKKTN